MKCNGFNKSSAVMNGFIWLSWVIYPEGEWIPGEPAFSQSIEILFCFANSQNAHYLSIISTETQINELPNPAHNKARVRVSKSPVPEVESSSLQLFCFDRTGNTQTRGFFVCHFDECPGHFHGVQMWRCRDPSWFQESIGVHKGRVNVHLLAWRDTEPQQKERLTTDLIRLLLCMCVS